MGSFTKLTYHIVFGTKFRTPSIQDEFRERLYEYIGGTIRGMKGHLIEIGGVEDHIHLLANLTPSMALSAGVRDIKSCSSYWISELSEVSSKFEWQKGYSAFSVSFSQISAVRGYIQNQQEHHRKQSFKDEYIEFLRRHEIPFEDRFLFEAEHHG